MKMRWLLRGVLSLGLLSGVALAAQGCTSASVGYCNTACTCESCDDQGRQDCIDYIENSRAIAVAAKCEPRFDEAVACLTDQSCKDGKIDESGCAVEVGSMNGCADAYYETYCAIYQEHLTAKNAECGVSQTPPGSGTCSADLGRYYACMDGCLAKLECACVQDSTGPSCGPLLAPYTACTNDCAN